MDQDMDVRCERCKTLYELDDARVSEAGTTVRCTTCGHVFRVRKKVLLLTEAVGAGGESTAIPPPVAEKPPWRVRSPNGRVIAFRELTSMQKWIVERKFGRDDEISLHGDSWKRLGDIAELTPFFLLLDEVDRVHELEERLRRAELPDEAPPLLERELGMSPPGAPPDPNRPAMTPIRLETPIDAPPEPAEDAGPTGSTTGPGPDDDRTFPGLGTGTAPPDRPGFEESSGPADRADTPRTGPPSAFSLDEIREATRPSPDDLPMPEGTVEPEGSPEEAEQPEFTRRAGLGVDPGLVEEAEGWGSSAPRSKAGFFAAFLTVLAAGAAVAAYFLIWVPAQEEKLRQEAERARLEQSQKARAAQEAEVQERERRAKEELVAGMAGKADAGAATAPTGARDAGTGGSAAPEPRGSAEPARPIPDVPPGMMASLRSGTAADPPRPRPVQPSAQPRSFDEWLARGDREREHARARAAVEAYGHAIAMEPTRAEAHVGEGRALLDLGDPRSAIAAFQRALERNPRYSVAEFWLGEAYRRSGRKPEAIEAYNRYVEVAPEGAEAARAQEALKGLQE
jgi:predicted Zn finger-like uncharacterized protein